MTKKLIIMGILVIPFLLLTRMATAQSYEQMPKEVQLQMDQNKADNVSLWNNIQFVYEVAATGLDADENKILLDRAKDNKSIISVDFDALGNVIVVCEAGTEFVNIKYIFSEIVSSISSIKTSGKLIKPAKK